MADEINTAGQGDGSQNYQMNRKLGTIFMLISATGMGLVPLFSRWATRTNMFDATQGLNGAWPHVHGPDFLRDSHGCHP